MCVIACIRRPAQANDYLIAHVELHFQDLPVFFNIIFIIIILLIIRVMKLKF
jgi:hypothetical protein